MSNYAEELEIIKAGLDFFVENNVEQECLEYETELIHECYERIIKVVKPYYIDGDVE